MPRLAGKVALVSGGGRSIPRALADEGAAVVLGGIDDERGEALADELAPAATYVRLDVTSGADWDVAVATALDRYGRLDVLVNDAAISIPGAVETYSRIDWDALLEVNLTGVFNGIRASLPALKQGGGAIIDVGPPAALVAPDALLCAAARQLAVYGIRVSRVDAAEPRAAATLVVELAAKPQARGPAARAARDRAA